MRDIKILITSKLILRVRELMVTGGWKIGISLCC